LKHDILTVGYYSKFSEKLKEIKDKDNETKLNGINEFLQLVQERELKRKRLADVYKQNYLNSLQKLNPRIFISLNNSFEHITQLFV
ncbi:32262_t:CDS:1, partial [Gigaspora margarita]